MEYHGDRQEAKARKRLHGAECAGGPRAGARSGVGTRGELSTLNICDEKQMTELGHSPYRAKGVDADATAAEKKCAAPKRNNTTWKEVEGVINLAWNFAMPRFFLATAKEEMRFGAMAIPAVKKTALGGHPIGSTVRCPTCTNSP